ncbi:MAG: multidrug efflux SMR transporter [Candidatus Methanomethylophilaceae archaeon]|jgi:quaternary ammonium compound-resistance protein SugE
MNPWTYIAIGGLFETGWAITLKMSNGFTDWIWLIPTAVLLVISTLLLNKGLVASLPAGSAYSVWVGIGAIGSLIAGLILFNDSLTVSKMICVVLIIAGVIGIEHEHGKHNEKIAKDIDQ